MSKRVCTKCGKEKLIENFYLKCKGGTKRNSWCSVCVRSASRKDYAQKSEDYIRRARKRTKENAKKNRIKYLQFLSSKKCVDCGNKDVRVLECDHLHDKKMGIARMLASGYKWESVLEEIKKCDIVCANCHKIRTYERAGSYRITGAIAQRIEQQPSKL